MDKNVSGVDLEELKRAREELDKERGVETDPNMYNNYNPNRAEQQLENSSDGTLETNHPEVSDEVSSSVQEQNEAASAASEVVNVQHQAGQSEENLSKLSAFSAFEVKDENSSQASPADLNSKEIEEKLENINDSKNFDSMLNDLLNDLEGGEDEESEKTEDVKSPEENFEKIPEDEMYHRDFNTSIDIEPKFDEVIEELSDGQDETNESATEINKETTEANDEISTAKAYDAVSENTQSEEPQQEDSELLSETQVADTQGESYVNSLENSVGGGTDSSDIITDFSQLKEILQTELKESEDAEKARIAKIEEQKQAESSKYPAIEDFKFINEIATDAFKSTDKFSYILGKNESGETVFGNFKEHFNMAIFGKNARSINSLLNSMILSLSLKNSYHDINFVLLDSNIDSAFDVYNKSSYLYFNRIAKTNKEIADTLVSIAREVDERYDKLAKLGVKSIDGYNEAAETGGFSAMPYIFIAFNNYTSATQATDSDKINTCLYQILKFGRNAGVYCVVTATLPIEINQVNYNLSSRISFKCDYDSRFTVGEKGAEDLLDNQDALYFNIASGKVIHIKTASIEDEELDHIIKDLED